MNIDPPPQCDFVIDLDDIDKDFYDRNGYLKVDQVTTAEELVWLRDTYDKLLSMPPTGLLDGIFDLSRPYGTTDTPKLGQLIFPERFAPQFFETAAYKNARRISAKLMGLTDDEIESWGHIIFKGANSMTETPWHQDEAYWDVTKSYFALGSWMALDDVDTDNGCLWFVPGSQDSDVLPHRHKDNNPKVHVLEFAEDVDVSNGIPVPLKAGGMTFHHARTWHYAGVNRTERVRRAWANEFQTHPVERETPAEHDWYVEGKKALAESVEKRGS